VPSQQPYPEFIKALPQAELRLPGVAAYLITSPQSQVAFFEIAAGAEYPPHSHDAQWGIIVEGQVELTIGGVVHRLGPGDSYSIGRGVEHSIKVLTYCRAIDVFEDPRRYQPRS
jgi:quercetin dioxygenase-like cupin family protein